MSTNATVHTSATTGTQSSYNANVATKKRYVLHILGPIFLDGPGEQTVRCGNAYEVASHLGQLIKVNNVQSAIWQRGSEGDTWRGLGGGQCPEQAYGKTDFSSPCSS